MDDNKAAEVMHAWTERDLSAAGRGGELVHAYGVDDTLRQVEELVRSKKHPMLAGPSGVGKTALVHEMVLRSSRAGTRSVLSQRRVLQFSFRQRVTALRRSSELGEAFHHLLDALEKQPDVVPFFRDFHLAYTHDLEAVVEAMCYRLPGPILAEGRLDQLEAMLEDTPELNEHYVIVRIEEPSFDQTVTILDAWAGDYAAHNQVSISPESLEQGLHLAHRFLSRDRLPRSALDLIRQTVSLLPAGATVEAGHVIARFSENQRIPRVLVDPEESLDLKEVRSFFSDRVLGQDEAVDAVVRMISMVKAGLSDIRRPFGVFLFAGPTGVGKTHLAQVLAEFLFSSRDRMVRLNMSDYPDENDAPRLFGDPSAFGVAAKRGLLSQRLAGHPFAVLLLDEFEKASRAVHDRFLQLFDEGWFVNGLAEPVPCRSLIIIATSNAGAEVYREHALGFISAPPPDQLEAEVERRIHRAFRFEFLNRFDELVHFRPLNREVIRTIAIRELQTLKERSGFRQRGLGLDVDEAVLDWLTVHGYDPHYGARFLRRTIQRTVATAVAEAIVKNQPKKGSHVRVAVRGPRVVAEVAKTRLREPRVPVRIPVGTEAVTRQLDRAALLEELDRLGQEARERLATLDEAREEARNLIERMNVAQFWGSAEEVAVVDRYRGLDVRIRSFERISGPLLDLLERDDLGEASVDTLARLAERAAQALAAWSQREADEGATEIWVALAAASALGTDGGLLADLVEIELAWCRTVGLTARVAAYAVRDDVPTMVVLDVEGPAAEAYLRMEDGLHRRKAKEGHDERVTVEVLVQGSRPAREPSGIAAVRQQSLAFGVEVAYRARLALKARGRRLELFGPERGLLAHVVHNLGARWQEPAPPSLDVVRVYLEHGQGARDPRTGASVASYKDVQRGRLDPLLEAWRRRSALGGVSVKVEKETEAPGP